MRKIVSILALFLFSSANASVVVDDSAAAGQWGTIQFDWVGGTIDINGLGYLYTNGQTGLGADDMFFSLLEDDGSSLTAFTGNSVFAVDDSLATGWDDDGSVLRFGTGIDSFISNLALASGSYLLAISHCCESFANVRDISQDSQFHQVSNDYKVTFSDGVTITASNGQPVPEPSTIALLALGIAGIRFSRKTRTN